MSKAMTKRKAPQVYNYVNCPAVKFKKNCLKSCKMHNNKLENNDKQWVNRFQNYLSFNL